MEKKLKPFDLEAAKAGAKVVTRDGHPARIICFERDDDYYPIIGLVNSGDGERVATYTKEGYFCSDKEPKDNDLFMAPEKHEGYVLVIRCKDGVVLGDYVYETYEDAEKSISNPDDGIVAKIEWEE